MKKVIVNFLFCCIVLSLCSCGQKALTWQEQYDLGVRYLTEGNYDEAIIAFTSAIEIDPKQEKAYIGLADAYIAAGDMSSAIRTIKRGIEATDNVEELQSRLEQLTSLEDETAEEMEEPAVETEEPEAAANLTGNAGNVENHESEPAADPMSYYVTDDEAADIRRTFTALRSETETDEYDGYTITYYDDSGRMTGWENYGPDEDFYGYGIAFYNGNGQLQLYQYFGENADSYALFEYDNSGNPIKGDWYSMQDGSLLSSFSM